MKTILQAPKFCEYSSSLGHLCCEIEDNNIICVMTNNLESTRCSKCCFECNDLEDKCRIIKSNHLDNNRIKFIAFKIKTMSGLNKHDYTYNNIQTSK